MRTTSTLVPLAGCALAVVLAAGWTSACQSPRVPAHPRTGVAELYATLYQQRATQLTRLQRYAQRGRFPHNAYKQGAVPVFVDGRGVHCAVGFLMKESGATALVNAIRKTNNLVKLYQVQHGPAIDWILRSGLTREECELIQPGYRWRRPHRPRRPVEPRRPKLPVVAKSDQPEIQHRLLATVRLLRKQTPAALQDAVRRRIPNVGLSARFDVLELRRNDSTFVAVQGKQAQWVRFSFLDGAGKLIKTGRWQRWTPGSAVSFDGAPQQARKVLFERHS